MFSFSDMQGEERVRERGRSVIFKQQVSLTVLQEERRDKSYRGSRERDREGEGEGEIYPEIR